MTDGRIKVQHDGMSHLIDQLGAGLAGIRSSLDTLDAEVSTPRERWSGEASDAYATAQRAWSDFTRDSNTQIETFKSNASDVTGTDFGRWPVARLT